MQKINMKKLNKTWRKLTKAGSTRGIKLHQKLDDVISLMGHDIPWDRSEKVDLACRLISGYQPTAPWNKNKERASAHKQKPAKSGPRKSKPNAFYASWEWKQVRYEALKMYGRRCMCCGWEPLPGSSGYLCVDHIKPRSKFPELELDVKNTQILCNSCNMGKSNVYEDDFRDEWEDDATDPLTAQFAGIMQ